MKEINSKDNLNQTFATFPKEKALGELISNQATKTPEKIAIKFGNSSISYKSLNEKANQLANLLISNNIKVGDIIALSLDRSIEMAICFLGVLKSGAAYIPLDPNFPLERLNFMLDDSGAKALITSKEYSHFSSTDRETFFQEDIFVNMDQYSKEEPITAVSGSDVVYILYTSGSTGKPKGVQIEHRNLINLLFSIKKSPGMTAEDIFLSVTTISFDIFELELYLPLLCGGLLIIADKDASRDGWKILQIIRDESVTILQATPYCWKMLLESGWEDYLPIKAFCGGEALKRKLANRLIPKCKELWNMYGPTETTIYSTIKHINSFDEVVTIGRPIDNTKVFLLNESTLVEPGEIGEICIAGDGVSRGYLNNKNLTAERFFENFDQHNGIDRLYRTGDLGRITNGGEVLCLGRLDHQIKIRGFRIEIEEIEKNLTALENIDDALLVVHTDSLGNERLVAYVINNIKISGSELKECIESWEKTLVQNLPDYMMPQAYHPIDFFPLTPNGKIDKEALPEPIFKSDLTIYEAPETDIENKLTEIWIKYLGFENIGVNDDFFDLGGHSIIAVQIMTQIEVEFKERLPISTFFQHPTIKKIAQLFGKDHPHWNWKTLVKIKDGTGKNPLYLIHGIGLNVLIFNNLANNLNSDQRVYGLQAIGLNGLDAPLDNFEEIASQYIGEMLEENPDGPFCLLGYSMGGIIALEMAKQLKMLGKEVTMLGMIDTNLKQYDGNTRSMILFNKFRRQFPKALFTIRSLFKHPISTIQYQYSFFKLKVKNVSVKNSLLKREVFDDNLPKYMSDIVEKLWVAMENYKITPYDDKIFLFKATKRLYYIDDFKYLGWKKYVRKEIIVKDVPGDHKVMLLMPNVIQFAEILQKVLNQL
ncbi:amino acid adenylation domain-containing protein [Pedobacter sp. UYEF25]